MTCSDPTPNACRAGGGDSLTQARKTTVNKFLLALLLLALLSPGSARADVTRAPGDPIYAHISRYAAVIPPNDDPADIYYPDDPGSTSGDQRLPFALLLQGANVDKQFYEGFARTVAGYGFVVVVPNHKTTVFFQTGLFAQEDEVNEVLAFMTSEDANASSPLHGKIDTQTMALLGHSYGGAVGLNAIAGKCQFPFCIGFRFNRPAALKGGAFYGTNLKGPVGGIPELDNQGIPIALVQGTLDGMAAPAAGKETFDKIQDPPKAYVPIEGANHYGITDVNDPPGAKPDPNQPEISQALSVKTIGKWSALFLRAYVLGDAEARAYFTSNCGCRIA